MLRANPTQDISVEAHLVLRTIPTNAATFLPAVAESDRDRVVGQPRLNQYRSTKLAIPHRDFDQVFVSDTQRCSSFATQHHGIVPSQLGDGVGKLLQPAIVVIATVIQAVVPMKNNFQALLSR